MNKDLQIGQRVRLSDDHRWTRDCTNPTDCDGLVDSVTEEWVGIEWENGYHNSYKSHDSDLIPVDATADSALETLV